MPQRSGRRPTTTAGIPHQQVDQQPTDPTVREWLAGRAFALPHVTEEPSDISVPGARALCLETRPGVTPSPAFLVGTEFAHLHPAPDFSLHMNLPTDVAEAAIAAGWAEWHPWVLNGRLPRTTVMVYAPRDLSEAEVVMRLLEESRSFALAGSDGMDGVAASGD